MENPQDTPTLNKTEMHSFIQEAKDEFTTYLNSDENNIEHIGKMLEIASSKIESYLDFSESEFEEHFTSFMIMELCILKVDYDEFEFDEMSDFDFAEFFSETYGHNLINGESYVDNMPEILDEVLLETFFSELADVGLEHKVFVMENGIINLTP